MGEVIAASAPATSVDGCPVDHIAVGVPDTEAGIAWLRALTGAEPYLTDPAPRQWYWSGALHLGSGRFLEVLGPNPAHRGFHPLKQTIRGFGTPRPIFWYVATPDFGVFSAKAKAAGAPVERVETVRHGRGGHAVDYTRGVLGPGFRSERPCVIEWRARPDRSHQDQSCRLSRFSVTSPIAAELNHQFQALGINLEVGNGPAALRAEIDAPRGTVEIAGRGLAFVGLSSVGQYLKLLLRHVLSDGS